MRFLEWWRRRKRTTKMRLVFYPSLFGSITGALLYMTSMPGSSFHGPPPELSPDDIARATSLHADVTMLARTIGERNLPRAHELRLAKEYIENELSHAGYEVHAYDYDVDGAKATNLEAEIKGTSQPEQIIVIGAHYDSVTGAPGADDNASGVAGVLDLAREFAGKKPAKTIRFVAFANEEPPYFWTESMGSLVYARACKAHGDQIVAMLSLETIGYFKDTPGSQKYPFPMSVFYPDKGDFIGFVGNTSSRDLTRRVIGTFRDRALFPSEGAALPVFIAGVGWSDQWSFWKMGYPGVMVTDTAPFRNPNYHTALDAPDTLDYARFARVMRGLSIVLQDLAD